MTFFIKGKIPDPDKVNAIETLENPKNKQDRLRILGMVSYLRHSSSIYQTKYCYKCPVLEKLMCRL